MTKYATIEGRFFAKVRKTETCWLWTAGITSNGYGHFRLGKTHVTAHRFAYELLIGPIPGGLQLDHVRARGCVHRHCVNPAHLEPVTAQENVRRSDLGKIQRDTTHCPQGHAYDDVNTYRRTNRVGRDCRACGRESSRHRRLKK